MLHYKFQRVNVRPDGSYIDYPDWIKAKKKKKKLNNKLEKKEIFSICSNGCIKL